MIQLSFLYHIFADDAYIERYMNAVFVHNAVLYFMEDLEDFKAGGFAVIDDEVRMLGGYLGIADGEADESAFFDHGAHMVSRRTEVHGAGASFFQRLLGASGNLVLLHFSLDFIFIAFGEVKFGAYDDISIVHENGIGIAIVKVIPAIGTFFRTISGNGIYFFHYFFHLAAVTICIHEYCAADGAGNADGPFKAFQAVFLGKAGNRTGSDAAESGNPGIMAGHFLFETGGADGNAPDAQVADKAVRTAADQGGADAFFMRFGQDFFSSPQVFGITKQSAGPPMP